MGPGNAYVAAAKRLVFGTVGIDMIAGPSEVLVVADADNDPDWIAADLLAQAEHDAAAQSILITDSADARRSRRRRRRAAAEDAAARRDRRRELARLSARSSSSRSLAAAMDLANRIAPEHLELAVADPEALLTKVRNAGAVFLGRHTPEVIGDYVGGPNHVLPTARSARFSSGLSVFDFLKRTSLLKLGPDQLRALARAGDHARRGRGPRRPRPLGGDPPQPVGAVILPRGAGEGEPPCDLSAEALAKAEAWWRGRVCNAVAHERTWDRRASARRLVGRRLSRLGYGPVVTGGHDTDAVRRHQREAPSSRSP